ncbi:MAG: lipopolysaccharide heptosyltransferase II [Gammaproteobacteria bacterium]
MSATLIIGPAWVGDMVMAQSLFALLHRQAPNQPIDVVGPPWSAPLVARMAEVRRGVPLAVAHGELALGERRRLGHALRSGNYDRAIVLPRSFKSALVPWFAKIPLRTGFGGEGRRVLLTDVRRLDRRHLDQTVKRFLALGLPIDTPLPEPALPVLRVDADNLARLVERFGLQARPRIALMPGAAFGPAKQWPVDYFRTLAGLLGKAGFAVWVLGSAGEQPLGEEICTDSAAVNLCGQTSLEDSVDLLSATQAVVTNDSGLMHVAAAAGTHVVALYGSTSPDFTPPLTSRRTILYRNLDCSPCFQRECPLGHLNCLREITPQAVADAVFTAVNTSGATHTGSA